MSALVGALVLMAVTLSARAVLADSKTWNTDQVVEVRINWDTFLDQGIPDSWRPAFEDAVINAYTKWTQFGGARVRAKFVDYTTRTSANSGEILIRMNESHTTDRLASCFASSQKGNLVIHRKQGSTGTPWNFVPYFAQAGQFDMEGLLAHEFGHCLGFLDHSTGVRDTMNKDYSWTRWRFGPFTNDVARMQALYGKVVDSVVQVHRSTDDGATWSAWDTLNLSAGIRNDTDAVKDGSKLGFFYSSTGNLPHFIWYSSGSWGSDTYFGGENSTRGLAADGENGTFLFAWVDGTNDDQEIRIVKSADGGSTWYWCAATDAFAAATPSIHHVSGSTWYLTYSRLDWSDRTRTGDVVVRKTTNNCASWGAEVDLTGKSADEISPMWLVAQGGVAATEHGSNTLIMFSWASVFQNYLDDRPLTPIGFIVDSSLDFVGGDYITGVQRTRSRPSITTGLAYNYRGLRQTNAATDVRVGRSSRTTVNWDGMFEQSGAATLNNSSTLSSPALAGDDDTTNVYAFFADD